MEPAERQALHTVKEELQNCAVVSDRMLSYLLQNQKITKAEKYELSVRVIQSSTFLVPDQWFDCKILLLPWFKVNFNQPYICIYFLNFFIETRSQLPKSEKNITDHEKSKRTLENTHRSFTPGCKK